MINMIGAVLICFLVFLTIAELPVALYLDERESRRKAKEARDESVSTKD